MTILVSCPTCGSTLSAPEQSAGKRARCGQCFEILSIPIPVAEEPLELAPEWLEEPAEPRPRPRAEPVEREPWPRLKAIPVPKPPPSRGLVLALSATLALMILLTAGGLGYAIWRLNHAEWKTHEPHGGYRVDLPAPPRDLVHLNRWKPSPHLHTFGTVHGLTNEEYSVLWMDVEAWQRSQHSDETYLDEAIRDMARENGGACIDSDRSLRQNGFSAREIVMRGGKLDGTYVCRLIIAETRFFIVVVGGGAIGPESENTRRFLDSFEIKKPVGR